MLLTTSESLIDCNVSYGLITILTSERVTIFHEDGVVAREISFANQMLAALPISTSMVAVVQSNTIITVYDIENGRSEIVKIEEVSSVICVCSSGRSLIIGGINNSTDKDFAIFVLTPLDEAVRISMAVEKLYNAVRFSNSNTESKPSVCLKTSISQSKSLVTEAVATIKEFQDDRKSIFKGSLLSSSSIGFFTEDTLRCLSKTASFIQNAETFFEKAVNKENARVDCLASELYIEGFFGNITQGVNGQVSDLHDYIYQKRKVEISSLLRNTKKPFVFQPNKKKLYAQFKECGITAWDSIRILKKASRKGLKRLGEPATTLATRKLMNELHSRTKGQRCRSSRSNHKKYPSLHRIKFFLQKSKKQSKC